MNRIPTRWTQTDSYYKNDGDQAFKWNHAIRMPKVGGENEIFLKCEILVIKILGVSNTLMVYSTW